jgi:hypothetical protein
MADIQTISVVIAAISVVIGVINSILSSRKADQQRQVEVETRQAELFMQMYNRWSTPDMMKGYGLVRFRSAWTDYDDWAQKYGPDHGDFDVWASGMSLFSFFEGLGVLVQRGLIDIGLVEDLMGNRLVDTWSKYRPVREEGIRRGRDPKSWDHTEYLYHELKQRQQLSKEQ